MGPLNGSSAYKRKLGSGFWFDLMMAEPDVRELTSMEMAPATSVFNCGRSILPNHGHPPLARDFHLYSKTAVKTQLRHASVFKNIFFILGYTPTILPPIPIIITNLEFPPFNTLFQALLSPYLLLFSVISAISNFSLRFASFFLTSRYLRNYSPLFYCHPSGDQYVIELILDMHPCLSPRAVVDIAILAMLNHSQSVQSHTGPPSDG